MDFKKYLRYRADESCRIGVVAHDLLEEEGIPFESKDDIIFEIIDYSFKNTPLQENWLELKSGYLAQRN